jgi:hypothetical protein
MSFIGLSDPAVQTGVGISSLNLVAGVATVPANTTTLNVAVPSSLTTSIYIASWSVASLSSAVTWSDSVAILPTTSGFTATFATNTKERLINWSKMLI